MTKLILNLSTLSLLFLVGCTTTQLSEKQTQGLTSVRVNECVTAEDAYHEPNARHPKGYADMGGASGGFIGSLLGSAIEASAMSSQQKKFEDKNAQHLDAVEAMMPDQIEVEIDHAILRAVIGNPFFANKIANTSSNQFNVELVRYGLTKDLANNKDAVTMHFHTTVKVELNGTGDRKLFSTIIDAASMHSSPIADYAQNPALLNEAVNSCLESLSRKLSDYLETKIPSQTQ